MRKHSWLWLGFAIGCGGSGNPSDPSPSPSPTVVVASPSVVAAPSAVAPLGSASRSSPDLFELAARRGDTEWGFEAEGVVARRGGTAIVSVP